VSMTRKHFEALAAALGVTDASFATVHAVGSVCYAANGSFDRGRFERRVEEWREKAPVVAADVLTRAAAELLQGPETAA
jgi:hypothetical protein